MTVCCSARRLNSSVAIPQVCLSIPKLKPKIPMRNRPWSKNYLDVCRSSAMMENFSIPVQIASRYNESHLHLRPCRMLELRNKHSGRRSKYIQLSFREYFDNIGYIVQSCSDSGDLGEVICSIEWMVGRL